MPVLRTLKVSHFIPGEQQAVYQHITAFPAQGEPDTSAMEQKYGQLLAQHDNTFTFLENIGGGIKWECVFDPPARRIMRAIDSTWSDRTDDFKATEGGTLWTITWQLKARGPTIFTQWLTFHLRTKRQVRDQAVWPVIRHFQAGN